MSDSTDFFKLFEHYFDSEEPFEWAHIPDKVKALCVRQMDYRTCMKLRQTARMEKSIVEENLPRFDMLYIQYYSQEPNGHDGHLKVYACVGTQVHLLYENPRTMFVDTLRPLMTYLSRHSNIRHVVLDGFTRDDDEYVLDGILKILPQSFRNLSLKYLSGECLQQAMEELASDVDVLDIWKPSNLDEVLQDELLVSMLINAKLVQIQELTDRIPIKTLIDYWIKHDKDFGSKLIVELRRIQSGSNETYDPEKSNDSMYEKVLMKFRDRIQIQDRTPQHKIAYINTNNPSTAIIMRETMESSQRGWTQYLTFTVTFKLMPKFYEASGLIRIPHVPPPTIMPTSQSSTSLICDTAKKPTVEVDDEPPLLWRELPVELCKPSNLDEVLQDELLESMLINAKLVRVQEINCAVPIETLIDFWITEVEEPGSKLIVELEPIDCADKEKDDAEEFKHPMYEKILMRFEDRIGYRVQNSPQKTAYFITIKTDRVVIMMRLLHESDLDKWSQFLYFKVITLFDFMTTKWIPKLSVTAKKPIVEVHDESPFHWRGLPVELRTHCLSKMDFASRMKLRRTSRLEKELVEYENNKPSFDSLLINDDGCIYVTSGNTEIRLMNYEREDKEKVETLIMSVLRYSTVKGIQLEHFGGCALNETTIEMIAQGGYQFAKMSIWQCESGPPRYFQQALLKIAQGVEHFEFLEPYYQSMERALRNTVIIPKILQATTVQIHMESEVPLNTFISLWLRYDKQIGSKLVAAWRYPPSDDQQYRYYQSDEEIFEEFLEDFGARVVTCEREAKIIRISMDDSTKHIIMRAMRDVYSEEPESTVEVTDSVVWQVIPASLKPEEYEKTSGIRRYENLYYQ